MTSSWLPGAVGLAVGERRVRWVETSARLFDQRDEFQPAVKRAGGLVVDVHLAGDRVALGVERKPHSRGCLGRHEVIVGE